MIGAILGDMLGSPYEGKDLESSPPLFVGDFTDDTIIMLATADAIINNGFDFKNTYIEWCTKYPNVGYGARFQSWLQSDSKIPYGSIGNGALLRSIPIAYLYNLEDNLDAFNILRESLLCTHNTPVAYEYSSEYLILLDYLVHNNASTIELSELIESLSESSPEVYKMYKSRNFETVFVFSSIIDIFSKSKTLVNTSKLDYENVIKNAILLGKDTDTQAALAGAIAEHLFGVPTSAIPYVWKKLEEGLDATDFEKAKSIIYSLYKGVDK